jgi:hypothetical protein
MTFSDYLFDSVLVLLVLRQIREARFDRKSVILPLVIIGWVANSYLHTVPTSGNNLLVVAALTLVGIGCGTLSALTTRVRTDGGRYALVKAGWIGAGVWVFSMGSRFAFAVWATHGGGEQLYRFGLRHDLDIQVWTAALILMALGEVLARTGILVVRTRKALAARPTEQPARELITAR